jgi:formylglycine-generating enzyme
MSTTRHQLRHMTWIPGGTFAMGSAGFYPEERPVHPVTVDFTPRHASATDGGCCAPHNPRVDTPAASGIFTGPGSHLSRRVIKGGSHLCAPSYGLRYRPAARQAEAVDTATCHLGFQCVVRGDAPPGR